MVLRDVNDIPNDKDLAIITEALAYTFPNKVVLLKMLLDNSQWSLPYKLAITAFHKSTHYKEGSRHYKVKMNAIRDRFLKDYLNELCMKKLIRNNILVTYIKLYWREPTDEIARWKFNKGRARFNTQMTREYFDKYKKNPYTITIFSKQKKKIKVVGEDISF